MIKYLITDSLIFKVRLPLLVSFHIPAKAFDNTKKYKTRCVALITLFSFKEVFIVSVFKILLLNYSRSRLHGIRKKCWRNLLKLTIVFCAEVPNLHRPISKTLCSFRMMDFVFCVFCCCSVCVWFVFFGWGWGFQAIINSNK